MVLEEEVLKCLENHKTLLYRTLFFSLNGCGPEKKSEQKHQNIFHLRLGIFENTSSLDSIPNSHK